MTEVDLVSDINRPNTRLTLLLSVATIVCVTAVVLLPHPGLAFFPLVLVACVALMWFAPGTIFAAYLYIPFYKGIVDPVLPVDLTALLAVICFLAALPVFRGLFRGVALIPIILWSAVAAIVVMGTTYAIQSDAALPKLASFIFLVYLPLLLGVRLASDQHLVDQFLISTVVLSGIVTLAGLFQLSGLGETERVAAMADTIGTARSALLLPLVVLVAYPVLPRWARTVSIPIILMSLVVAVSSGSRGPLLMIIVTLVLMAVLNGRRLVQKAVGACLALIIGIGVFQLPYVREVLPRESLLRLQSFIRAISSSDGLDSVASARLDLYQIALEMFEKRPISGFGTAGFEVYARRVGNLDLITYPHNLLLEVAADFGLLGLIVVGTFLFAAFSRGLSLMQDTRTRVILATATFSFLNALVSSSIYDNRWTWGMLVMLLALKMGVPNHRDSSRRVGGLSKSC